MVMFRHNKESGAVSLFVVVFAMLLITIVTISFLRLMLRDQQQASTNDLSQSAYDSAQAGVEDAKRALILYRTVCNGGDVSACNAEQAIVNSTDCNKGLQHVINTASTDEVTIQQQQSAGDTLLNQAYTCVKISLQTDDYLGTLTANSSKIVPLISTGPFSSVIVQWYTTSDSGTAGANIDLAPLPPQQDSGTLKAIWPLLAQSSWPTNRPSLMRTQLMQFGSSFTLDSFDATVNGTSNANTIFLYPTGKTNVADGTQDTVNFSSDVRGVSGGAPQPVHCSGNLSGGGYACSVKLNLPLPVGNSDVSQTRNAYLRLTSLYGATHFRVSMVGTQFNAVQPSIDSTGRANDLYRRVSTRVDLVDTNFPFPDASVNVSGNLCKDFLVTDDSSIFSSACTP